MSDKMKIGELLLLQEKIDPWHLSTALKEQAQTRHRLISMLINRALLDPDEGAMMLSEQLGYPAAMQRHLERRDASVLTLLPPQLGARWVVLPLGRARTGAIVVVARDPTPILNAALEHAMREDVVLAVTPSVQLERLVRAAYGSHDTPEAEPLPESPPSLSEIGNVRLEDETPLPIRRARTVSFMFPGLPELPIRAPQQVAPIEATLQEIDRAITAGAVERLVMAYAAKRWRAALLARFDGANAVGVRGHGPQLDQPDQVTLPLAPPSMLTLARNARRATTEAPGTQTQQRLHDLLDAPVTPAAAPVVVADHVDAVLAVGDVVAGSASESLAELDRLADALGAAYVRFSR
ncbi:MAG TPA: hypothetical protein VIV11_09015 [Kofleriaceae bacterium]